MNISVLASKYKEYTEFHLDPKKSVGKLNGIKEKVDRADKQRPSLHSWSKGLSGNLDQTDNSMSHDLSNIGPIFGGNDPKVAKSGLINILSQDH